ncbi:unnamed protein product, partial [Iphiclides podalirius]
MPVSEPAEQHRGSNSDKIRGRRCDSESINVTLVGGRYALRRAGGDVGASRANLIAQRATGVRYAPNAIAPAQLLAAVLARVARPVESAHKNIDARHEQKLCSSKDLDNTVSASSGRGWVDGWLRFRRYHHGSRTRARHAGINFTPVPQCVDRSPTFIAPVRTHRSSRDTLRGRDAASQKRRPQAVMVTERVNNFGTVAHAMDAPIGMA